MTGRSAPTSRLMRTALPLKNSSFTTPENVLAPSDAAASLASCPSRRSRRSSSVWNRDFVTQVKKERIRLISVSQLNMSRLGTLRVETRGFVSGPEYLKLNSKLGGKTMCQEGDVLRLPPRVPISQYLTTHPPRTPGKERRSLAALNPHAQT